MAQHYSDKRRESSPYSLPDVETFYINARRAAEVNHVNRRDSDDEGFVTVGWYWWSCLPGCLPDSDPCGPFDSEAAALADARDGIDDGADDSDDEQEAS